MASANSLNQLDEFLQTHGRTDLAILGIPYDGNSSLLTGSAQAPRIIMEAFTSDASNLWTESGIDLSGPSAFFHGGHLELEKVDDVFGEIEAAVDFLLDSGLRPVLLGGDHSITFPILRAFRRRYPSLSLLHFDAHPDLYDEFEGNRHSHACPFARIMENRLVDRLVQVGIRATTGHQREQAERFGVEMIEMRDWQDGAVMKFDTPLYVSFDLDALDPSFAPGVSHPEAGGFSTREVLRVIQSLEAPVVGADIVEFNPRRDPLRITAAASAKILKEILAKMLESG
jgi:agmatinase